MATSTTHECPAPDCKVQVQFAKLTCRGHWYEIPRELRDRLLREYSHSFGERSYFEARDACLRALGVPEDDVASLNGGVS